MIWMFPWRFYRENQIPKILGKLGPKMSKKFNVWRFQIFLNSKDFLDILDIV